jgi:hypothetical protein
MSSLASKSIGYDESNSTVTTNFIVRKLFNHPVSRSVLHHSLTPKHQGSMDTKIAVSQLVPYKDACEPQLVSSGLPY